MEDAIKLLVDTPMEDEVAEAILLTDLTHHIVN